MALTVGVNNSLSMWGRGSQSRTAASENPVIIHVSTMIVQYIVIKNSFREDSGWRKTYIQRR